MTWERLGSCAALLILVLTESCSPANGVAFPRPSYSGATAETSRFRLPADTQLLKSFRPSQQSSGDRMVSESWRFLGLRTPQDFGVAFVYRSGCLQPGRVYVRETKSSVLVAVQSQIKTGPCNAEAEGVNYLVHLHEPLGTRSLLHAAVGPA